VNTIRGLGEEFDESVVVQKVIISLTMRFDPKISSLEERTDIDSLSMDELHGIFTVYEMRIEEENPIMKESSLEYEETKQQKFKSKLQLQR
jgi:hypothetical protein